MAENRNNNGCGCGCLVMILTGLVVIGGCNYILKQKVRDGVREELDRQQRTEKYSIEGKLDSIDSMLNSLKYNLETNEFYRVRAR